MKKIIYFSLIALLAACSENDSDNENNQQKEKSIAFVALADTTRAYRQENNGASETMWEQGDKIGVWSVTSDNQYYCFNRLCTAKSNGVRTTFTPSETTGINYKFFANYPYSEENANTYGAKYVAYNIPSEQNITTSNGRLTNDAKTYQVGTSVKTYNEYSTETEVELHFHNICSTIEFGLKGESNVKLSSISISAINNGGFEGGLSEKAQYISLENSYTNKYPYNADGSKASLSTINSIKINFTGGLALSSTEQKIQIPVGHFKMGAADALLLTFTNDKNQSFQKEIWTSREIDLSGTPMHIYQPIASIQASDFSDVYWTHGEVYEAQTHSQGNGIDLYFVADGYTKAQHKKISKVGATAESMAEQKMNAAKDALFEIEPYKTFKNYFNIYYIFAYSIEEGISINGSTKNTFYKVNHPNPSKSTQMIIGGGSNGDSGVACKYFIESCVGADITGKSVLVVANSSVYGGTCHFLSSIDMENLTLADALYAMQNKYKISTTFAICPTASQFNILVHHEFGGHGFGHLADEYWYDDNAEITSTDAQNLMYMHYVSVFPNVDTKNTTSTVNWKALCNDSDYYPSEVGIYEGGYYCGKGVYRPANNSIMRNNTNGYNAPSRLAIYERIITESGGTYSFNNFITYDKSTNLSRGITIQQTEPQNYVPLAPPVFKYHKK